MHMWYPKPCKVLYRATLNIFLEMNDTFKIKKTRLDGSSVIFSSIRSYFSAMSWMIWVHRTKGDRRTVETFFDFKSVVHFLEFVKYLLLSRSFGNIIQDIAEKYEHIELKMTEELWKYICCLILKVSYIFLNSLHICFYPDLLTISSTT